MIALTTGQHSCTEEFPEDAILAEAQGEHQDNTTGE